MRRRGTGALANLCHRASIRRMTTATMNVSLPGVMREFVDSQTKTGGYGSTSEYVRELIRKDQIVKGEAQLRELIMKGLNSGPAVIADDAFFNRVRERALAAAKA
jgi:antitoxin ParD1/3/4